MSISQREREREYKINKQNYYDDDSNGQNKSHCETKVDPETIPLYIFGKFSSFDWDVKHYQ